MANESAILLGSKFDYADYFTERRSLQGQLAVGWGGSPSSPGSGITSTPCSGADHEWVALPGGYWVSHTMCATLLLRVDGQEQQVTIGLGDPCPGQLPPGGPSDK